jgi:gluconokinase
MIAILMGVAGSGKSTIAQALVSLTGWQFAEGDDYHSEANRRKMHSGIPLTDEDRIPWLNSLHDVLTGWHRSGASGVLTCSALKQSYRDLLVKDLPAGSYKFVLLDAPTSVLALRMNSRPGHFMNPGLLQSQLETLEMPADALLVNTARDQGAILRGLAARAFPEWEKLVNYPFDDVVHKLEAAVGKSEAVEIVNRPKSDIAEEILGDLNVPVVTPRLPPLSSPQSPKST